MRSLDKVVYYEFYYNDIILLYFFRAVYELERRLKFRQSISVTRASTFLNLKI